MCDVGGIGSGGASFDPSDMEEMIISVDNQQPATDNTLAGDRDLDDDNKIAEFQCMVNGQDIEAGLLGYSSTDGTFDFYNTGTVQSS